MPFQLREVWAQVYLSASMNLYSWHMLPGTPGASGCGLCLNESHSAFMIHSTSDIDPNPFFGSKFLRANKEKVIVFLSSVERNFFD